MGNEGGRANFYFLAFSDASHGQLIFNRRRERVLEMHAQCLRCSLYTPARPADRLKFMDGFSAVRREKTIGQTKATVITIVILSFPVEVRVHSTAKLSRNLGAG